MKKVEILNRLNNGDRIVEMVAPYGTRYFMSKTTDYGYKDTLSKKQFETYKLLCNKCLDEHHKRWLREQSGYCFYWLE